MKSPIHRLPLLLGGLLAATALQVFGATETAPLVRVPRFSHPGTGQVFYFVLTDRFENGSPSNDTGGIAGGRGEHGFDSTVISHYHGGDFVGMTRRLDYLKSLGITSIWITPPFVNKPVQLDSAGYHGYWILDFTKIDPHLGTDAEFREFVAQAHAKGLRIYLDIVVNHTADVIRYKGGDTVYREISQAPYKDAAGKPFDAHAVAFNGVGTGADFPVLSAEKSFAYQPVVSPSEAQAKGPAWLNDATLYHNRGNSVFKGENSLHGDFVGLDDVFTENPAVVKGFIDVYSRWMKDYGIDGYRIDTVKHANLEFWQAFGPAIREQARQLGRPDFFEFGEVSDEHGDAALLSEFTTNGGLDASLDFGLFGGARGFFSQGHDAAELARVFAKDDYYTDHDSNADGIPTFLSNHDGGRFAYFLQEDNPGISRALREELVLLAHGLLFTVRGQPILYYGDEQGMEGTGNDMKAREDMFPSKAAGFKELTLLGTKRTGVDDKFDQGHPFYQAFKALSELRRTHAGLAHGAMILRDGGQPGLFAFSRVERNERIEYLVALNNSRTQSLATTLQTSQAGGAVLKPLYNSKKAGKASGPVLKADARGAVSVSLAPLQMMIWRAEAELPVPAKGPSISLSSPLPDSSLAFGTRRVDGHTLVMRQEIRAELGNIDGVGEVTFALQRSSRPGQYQLLGTDDAPPYRIFWRPPADLLPGEELSFIATVDDLRGHQASAQVEHVTVAAGGPEYGIKGATVPWFTKLPVEAVSAKVGGAFELTAAAEGTGPLEYQWYHDGRELAGATSASFRIEAVKALDAGRYSVKVHGREGSTLSRESTLTVTKH